jgi:TolB-like protein
MLSYWKKSAFIASMIVALVLAGGAGAQTISYQKVTSDGIASTYEDAVTQALQSAVAKVNGVEVARKVVTESVRGGSTAITTSQSATVGSSAEHTSGVAAAVVATNDSNNNSQAASGVAAVDGLQQAQTASISNSAKIVNQDFVADKTTVNASAQTSGVVNRYQVINSGKQDDGWHVTILAEISVYNAALENQRRKVAVLPLRLARDDQNFRGFETAFRSDLINQLTQSSKLAVLDRDFSGEQDSELGFLKEDGIKKEEAARLGNKLGADYIIAGIVDDVSVKTPAVYMQAIGKTVTGQITTSVRVSLRVIETATGRISLADTWAPLASSGAKIEAIADNTAGDVAHSVLDALFPIRIEHISNGVFYLGQGGKTVQVGQRYRVVALGKEITDSYTKEVIGREEEDVGVIEIFEVEPKLAKARLIGAASDKPLPSDVGTLVARLQKTETAQTAKRPQDKPDSTSAKALLKKNDGEW